MHPIAKRCVQWAIGLLVLGAVVLIYGAQAYSWLSDVAGANADTGLDAVNIILTIVRSTTFPLGAVLIGAAIVVHALADDNTSRAGADVESQDADRES